MTAPRTLTYLTPATRWIDALPIGNGRLGAMVHGDPAHERIALNLDTLWSGNGPRSSGVVGGPQTLARVRDLVLRKGDPVAAGEASLALEGPDVESFQPLGDLLLDIRGPEATSDYQRSLDPSTGVAVSRVATPAGDRTQQVLTSAVDGVLVVRLEQDGGTVDVDARLVHPHRDVATTTPRGARGPLAVVAGRAPTAVTPSFADAGEPVRYAEGEGIVFAAALGALVDGGQVAADGSTLSVTGARSVTFVLAADDSYAGWQRPPRQDATDVVERVAAAVERGLDVGWPALRERAVADHGALADRVELHLAPADQPRGPVDERLARVRAGGHDDTLVELLVDMGRHLLISSSRPGTEAANLQGIWNEDVRPAWCSDWTVNINTQMNYWPAEVAALGECHEPLLDLVRSLPGPGAVSAREIYDADGWVTHHNVDLWRTTWAVGGGTGAPSFAIWPMGGVWLAAQMLERDRFAPDDARLADDFWPVIRGAAAFVLDLLVTDPRPGPTQGRLVTVPSTSPENGFLDAQGRSAAVDAMVTMDLWLVRELFASVLDAADRLDLDGDDVVARVRDAVPQLPDVPIGSDGRLLEWITERGESEPGHRHMSHLYGLHPGAEIDPAGTPDWAAAVRRSLEARLAAGGGHTGWSRSWLVSMWARLGDGEAALASVDTMLAEQITDNMFCLHPPGIFQIDGNFGIVAGILEMLLQSHTDVLRLLPALPARWHTGSVRGLRARRGIACDMAWAGGRLTSATLTATSDRDVTVAWPGSAPTTVTLRAGEPLTLPSSTQVEGT